ncbi:helix-turn-helix domain-containing protein [Streptomyces sp. AV19]|nr:helix-turn-helix transcriptional regulator [Streptomyces sp. AV19]MBH1934081.1 helix-turn-helix domain-containing protein [Streptomyces sp. AV19]MDG4535438.1 helix-turn-helix domain-containing protein [Streptomyces sp. AV19]
MARVKLPSSVRQRRLGAELRRLRERANLSATRAAELFGTSQSRISGIEAGGYAVSAERVRALARLYGCEDRSLIEALTRMTGGRTRGWWEEYRGIVPADALDLAELEHHATSLRVASMIHLPGLLQTREQARVVMAGAVPALAPFELEHRISYRIKRQGVLYGDMAKPLTAIVHEAALRMDFGGPEVTRKQLQFLLERGREEHICVLVIPFGSGPLPSAGNGIVHCGGEVSQLDSVQLDTDHGSVFIDAEVQLGEYRTILDRMQTCALDPAESSDLIQRIAREL